MIKSHLFAIAIIAAVVCGISALEIFYPELDRAYELLYSAPQLIQMLLSVGAMIITALSFLPAEDWRSYFEVAVTYGKLGPLQKPLRLQAGLEYESSPMFFEESLGWYVALDAQSLHESNWRVSTALQIGFVIPKAELGRTARFGLEFYQGRSPMGEFFFYREDHLALGWWLDF